MGRCNAPIEELCFNKIRSKKKIKLDVEMYMYIFMVICLLPYAIIADDWQSFAICIGFATGLGSIHLHLARIRKEIKEK